MEETVEKLRDRLEGKLADVSGRLAAQTNLEHLQNLESLVDRVVELQLSQMPAPFKPETKTHGNRKAPVQVRSFPRHIKRRSLGDEGPSHKETEDLFQLLEGSLCEECGQKECPYEEEGREEDRWITCSICYRLYHCLCVYLNPSALTGNVVFSCDRCHVPPLQFSHQ